MQDVAASQVVPAALGALGGGAGVVWLAKLLIGRMITQYDKRHEEHAKKLDRLVEALNAALTRVAVLEAVLEDARRLRLEVEERVSKLRGELEAKHAGTVEEVADLRTDLWVAHERVRRLAGGDVDIEKIQKPERIARRR